MLGESCDNTVPLCFDVTLGFTIYFGVALLPTPPLDNSSQRQSLDPSLVFHPRKIVPTIGGLHAYLRVADLEGGVPIILSFPAGLLSCFRQSPQNLQPGFRHRTGCSPARSAGNNPRVFCLYLALNSPAIHGKGKCFANFAGQMQGN